MGRYDIEIFLRKSLKAESCGANVFYGNFFKQDIEMFSSVTK